MDDLVVVEVLAPQQDLVDEVPRLRLRNSFPPLVQLHQAPLPAQLQDDEDKIAVLEVAEQFDDVGVGHGLVESGGAGS